MRNTCSQSDCNRYVHGQGLCSKHYHRKRYHAMTPAQRSQWCRRNHGYEVSRYPVPYDGYVSKPSQEQRIEWEIVLRAQGLGMSAGLNQWRLFYGWEEKQRYE